MELKDKKLSETGSYHDVFSDKGDFLGLLYLNKREKKSTIDCISNK